MSNAEIFKSYLDKEDFGYDTWEDEGVIYFQFKQKLKSGPSGRFLVCLKGDALVNIYGLDYITLSNTSKIDAMYKLLNGLNSEYTYFKFFLNDNNNIILQTSMPIDNNFKAEIIIHVIGGAINALDEEYAGIMKTMWS